MDLNEGRAGQRDYTVRDLSARRERRGQVRGERFVRPGRCRPKRAVLRGFAGCVRHGRGWA